MPGRALLLAGGTCLWLAALVTTSCGSSTLPSPDTDGCTADRLTAALNGCQFQLTGDIIGQQCLSLMGAADAIKAGNYSVRACQEQKAARLVMCIADNVAQCSYEADAGAPVSVVSQCQYQVNPDQPTPDATCVQQCATKRQTCESACPATKAQDCFDCSFQCGSAQVTCLSACPAAK